MKLSEDNLYFSIDSLDALTINDLLELLILSCGGKFNPAYFQFLDMDISECLYHLYIFINLKQKEGPSPENKLKDWGFSTNDFGLL